MSRFVVFLSIIALAGCAGKSKVSLDEPEPMDRPLNARTNDKGEAVGVRDDQIVVQKRVYLEEEMAKIGDSVEDLENSIYGQSVKDPGGLWLALQDCRKRMSDVRIGGNGVPEPMETWEKPSQTEIDFDYRVDKKNNVVAVTEQELGQRISNLKKTRNILERRFQDYKQKSETCETKYKTALVQHGLNPNDTEAAGEWVDNGTGSRVWKMRRPATKDPEELMRRKQKREKQEEQGQ